VPDSGRGMSTSDACRGKRSRGDDSDEPDAKLEDDSQPDRPICRDYEKGRGSKPMRLRSDDPQRKGGCRELVVTVVLRRVIWHDFGGYGHTCGR
jgi:hypothetical protein